jgi:chaperonin GroES
MNLTPTLDRIILEEEQVKETTAGGLFIPESARGKNDFKKGKVLAVGPGKRLPDGTVSEPGVRRGQTVVFDPVGAAALKVDGKDLLVMRFENVLAVENT